jgi:phosphoglycolate phosphatase-like HAD superfamily hydrolase
LNEGDLGQAFEEHYDQIASEAQPPFPGVLPVCEYICNLGGRNLIITHRGQAGTDELLAAHNMTHYFTGCIARDDGYPRKPDPAAFEAMLRTQELRREETMAVGDREIDILAGRAAGLFTCLFALKADSKVADLTVSSFDELYRYLAPSSNQLGR